MACLASLASLALPNQSVALLRMASLASLVSVAEPNQIKAPRRRE
jgi:hypothetical protein